MISGEFLAALVDSLAPGGSVATDVTLPAASIVGCDRALAEAMVSNSNLRALIEAIAAQAGDAQSFVASDPRSRIACLETAQRERPESFASLVTATLAHYYAQPHVLAALDWPSRPPQPEGHRLPPFDDSLLAKVKARGALWRTC